MDRRKRAHTRLHDDTRSATDVRSGCTYRWVHERGKGVKPKNQAVSRAQSRNSIDNNLGWKTDTTLGSLERDSIVIIRQLSRWHADIAIYEAMRSKI